MSKKLEEYVVTIPDFPEPGIMFRDITSVIQDPDGLKLAVDGLVNLLKDTDYDVVIGPESRGFIFGDQSFTSAICYDFEVYSEAQKRWLEVSSVSNFDTYQANRLKCRFRNAEKKTELCHTLNGSALALPRIVASILENNQTEDGIRVPKALVPYMGCEIIN